MHQGLGLETFNDLPRRKAVHALYECCGSVTWATHIADGRMYSSYEEIFAAAGAELNELSDADVDVLLTTLPDTSKFCAAIDADTRSALTTAFRAYEERFGFRYVVCRMSLPDLSLSELADPRSILVDLGHRLDNNLMTERAVMREELARTNRERLARLLGPEGGWPPF